MENLNESLELVKSHFFKDGSIDWSFVPSGSNLERVRVTVEAIIDGLYIIGEKELSERTLRQTLHYLVEQSRVYYRNEGASEYYVRRYGYSPCCCCNWQERISSVADTLGYHVLSVGAVSIQCPRSPEGYRPAPAQGEPVESRLNDPRKDFIEKRLRDLVEGKVDFLSR